MTQSHEELIYGFDPLCGWCFAFGPTIRAIADAHPDLPIRIRTGGLVTGERVQPISAMHDYLVQGLADVKRRSGVAAGQPFFDGLLAEGTYISNSEPPCRAIYVMQQLAPEQVFPFAVAMPDVMYKQGLPLDDENVLGELVAAQGVDVDAFLERWRSDEAKAGTQRAFAAARAGGITMYPTLLFRRGDEMTLVGRGFMLPEDAVAQVGALRSDM